MPIPHFVPFLLFSVSQASPWRATCWCLNAEPYVWRWNLINAGSVAGQQQCFVLSSCCSTSWQTYSCVFNVWLTTCAHSRGSGPHGWSYWLARRKQSWVWTRGAAGGAGCRFWLPKGVVKGRQRQAPGSRSVRGHWCQRLRGKSLTVPSITDCPHCPPRVRI